MITVFVLILLAVINEQNAVPFAQNDADNNRDEISMAQQLLKKYESVLNLRPLTQGCKFLEVLDVETEANGRAISKVVAKYGCLENSAKKTCTLKFINDALRDTSTMTNADCIQSTSEESDT